MTQLVYFASRYDDREWLLELAEKLPPEWECCSRWLSGKHIIEAGLPHERNADVPLMTHEIIAQEDWEDLQRMDALVFFAEPGGQRGGRHVEYGVALGRNVPVIVVSFGHKLNTFHYLKLERIVVVENWTAETLPDMLGKALNSVKVRVWA